MKTYRSSGGIAPLILDLNTRWRWVVYFTSRLLYPRERTRYSLNTRLVGPQSWSFWRRRSFASIGIRSLDRPARNLVTVLRENITNCVQQSLSWQADCFLASQDIPFVYKTQGFITVVRKDGHLSLSWARSVQFKLSSYFLEIHFNIILPSTPRSYKWYISLRIPNHNSVCTFLSSSGATSPFRIIILRNLITQQIFNVVWSGLHPDQTTLEGSSGTSSMTCTGGCGYSF